MRALYVSVKSTKKDTYAPCFRLLIQAGRPAAHLGSIGQAPGSRGQRPTGCQKGAALQKKWKFPVEMHVEYLKPTFSHPLEYRNLIGKFARQPSLYKEIGCEAHKEPARPNKVGVEH